MTPLLIAVEDVWGVLFAVLASMPSPTIPSPLRRALWTVRVILGVGALLFLREASAHFVSICGAER
jgi:hypothetical protein